MNECLKCDENYELVNGYCYEPKQDDTTEEECPNGYYKDQNGECVGCQVENCLACGTDQNTCIQCDEYNGYKLNSNNPPK